MGEIVLRAIHLAAVGAAVWLPAFCIALERDSGDREVIARSQCRLASAALIGMIAGALTGVLYGAWLWGPGFRAALTAIGSRLNFAIVEFSFSFVVYLLYWGWLARKKTPGRGWQVFRSFLLFVAITNLAYHFPVLLGVVHQLALSPPPVELSSAEFRSAGFSPKVVWDAIHFLLGAFVVSNQVMIALLRSEQVSTRFLRCSIVWAIVAVCLQWPSGLAAFGFLPRATQVGLVGTPGGIGIFIGMLAIWLNLATLVGLCFRPRSTNWLWMSTACLAWVLVQMSWLRCE